jgi:uncharacterized protein
MSLLQKLALALLRGYKWAISPMFLPSCRYVPTCSEYAMEAVSHHGALRGSLMALWRLLRCHPFARGGFDPVKIPNNSGGAGVCNQTRICSH